MHERIRERYGPAFSAKKEEIEQFRLDLVQIAHSRLGSFLAGFSHFRRFPSSLLFFSVKYPFLGAITPDIGYLRAIPMSSYDRTVVS
jgi:hypothetical protein